MQLLPPLLTGSDKFGWEHVADKSASPTYGQLLIPYQLGWAVFEVGCFCAMHSETLL